MSKGHFLGRSRHSIPFSRSLLPNGSIYRSRRSTTDLHMQLRGSSWPNDVLLNRPIHDINNLDRVRLARCNSMALCSRHGRRLRLQRVATRSNAPTRGPPAQRSPRWCQSLSEHLRSSAILQPRPILAECPLMLATSRSSRRSGEQTFRRWALWTSPLVAAV